MEPSRIRSEALDLARKKAVPARAAPRTEYLDTVAHILRAWIPLQRQDGAVMDPLLMREVQYGTPAFALSAAVLASSGRGEWLEPAVRALDVAIAAVCSNRAVDGHGNFYSPMIMRAWPLIQGRVRPERRRRWEKQIRALNPWKAYQDLQKPTHNWNLLACCGEAMRASLGLGGDSRFCEKYLPDQLRLLNEWGMYRDPGCPLAYDIFPRAYVEEALAWKVAAFSEAWNHRLETAALTSLFLQSPAGEWPSGGRSSHHQWNEAALAWSFENRAGQAWDRGDVLLAGTYRRAATLALESVRRWLKPGAGLFIVKNRAPDRERLGFETYSHPANYSLLAASHLACASLRVRGEIPGRACPAETGGFTLATPRDHHKVILNAKGWYVLMDPLGHPGYQAPGILKIHHRGLDAEESWSEGFFPSARTGTQDSALPPLSTGPAGLSRSGEEVLDLRLDAFPEPGWATLTKPQRVVSVWRSKKGGRIEAAMSAEAASSQRLELTGWSRDGQWALVEPQAGRLRIDFSDPYLYRWISAKKLFSTARGPVRLRIGEGKRLRVELRARTGI